MPFHYTISAAPYSARLEEVQRMLAKAADQRWELISVFRNESMGQTWHYFRRDDHLKPLGEIDFKFS